MNDTEKKTFIRFLRSVKEAGKFVNGFEEDLLKLQNHAKMHGLEDEVLDLLSEVLTNNSLGAIKLVGLVKCLIPRYKMPPEVFKTITTWCLASVKSLQITVSSMIIHWIIGLWDYQLIDRKLINMYYEVLFYIMLKKEKLEKRIARLVYVLTKPEDVTRRNVSRLLNLQKRYSKPPTHIVALLSLFKSYKPELVPEKIQSVNVKSVWKPISEVLCIAFEEARNRSSIVQSEKENPKSFNWNTFQPTKTRKSKQILLPSVGYFQIGSSIFKKKDTKSIFDVSSIEELGKSHLNIELPSNAVSLLANVAGYHLLAFADFHYQSRFSYNLYNTLSRAFILEIDKFSEDEKAKLLDATIEFSRYTQQGILVVNLFFDEYQYFNTGEHQSKVLALVPWMTSLSVTELQEKLAHIQKIYYESSLRIKCEIIKALRILITNLYVEQELENNYENPSPPFLGQGPMEKLEDIVPIIQKIARRLIVAGLNIHSNNVVLLSEALTFYEVICTLETKSNGVLLTFAPTTIIYASFLTRYCAILSRICRLLISYCDLVPLMIDRGQKNILEDKVPILNENIRAIITAIWHDEIFPDQTHFLQNFSKRMVNDLHLKNFNKLLSIRNHYAVLPYMYTLRRAGLTIDTHKHAKSIAYHYYPAVSEFIDRFNNP